MQACFLHYCECRILIVGLLWHFCAMLANYLDSMGGGLGYWCHVMCNSQPMQLRVVEILIAEREHQVSDVGGNCPGVTIGANAFAAGVCRACACRIRWRTIVWHLLPTSNALNNNRRTRVSSTHPDLMISDWSWSLVMDLTLRCTSACILNLYPLTRTAEMVHSTQCPQTTTSVETGGSSGPLTFFKAWPLTFALVIALPTL